MPNTETNSANSANQPAEAGNASKPLTRARPHRTFDATAISAICRLCAKSLTEREAALLLGYSPRAWYSFKARGKNSEKFEELLTEFRADRIDSLIDRIEKSADGVGMKQPDWRASAHLLAIADAKRFSTSGMTVNVPVQVNCGLTDADMHRVMDKVFRENPELEADGLFTDVRLGYRKRDSLEWIQTPGQPPKRTKIRPEVRELLLAKLNTKAAVEISASVEPKQIENALPEKCEGTSPEKCVNEKGVTD
jgi:hypothetical protein